MVKVQMTVKTIGTAIYTHSFRNLCQGSLKKIRNSNGGFNVVTLFWKEKLMLRFLHVNYYSI